MILDMFHLYCCCHPCSIVLKLKYLEFPNKKLFNEIEEILLRFIIQIKVIQRLLELNFSLT